MQNQTPRPERYQFTGTLKQTRVRPDGPAGVPMTQALFHSTDAQSIVAVWHDMLPPENLSIGETYDVEGTLVHHRDHDFFFHPVVQAVEAVQERLRHPLLRPLSWPLQGKIAAIAGSIAIITISAVGYGAHTNASQTTQGGDLSPSSYDSSSSNQTSHAATVSNTTGTDHGTAASTPVANSAQCDVSPIPYGTTTQNDATISSGQSRVLVSGSAGVKSICYPNGRDKPSVTSVTKQPVTRVIAMGTKQSSTASTTQAPSSNTSTGNGTAASTGSGASTDKGSTGGTAGTGGTTDTSGGTAGTGSTTGQTTTQQPGQTQPTTDPTAPATN